MEVYADAVLKKDLQDTFSSRTPVFVLTSLLSIGIIAYAHDNRQVWMFVQSGHRLPTILNMQAAIVFVLVFLFHLLSAMCYFGLYWWHWQTVPFSTLLQIILLKTLSVSVLCFALILISLAFKTLIRTAIADLILLFSFYIGLFSRVLPVSGLIFELRFPIAEAARHVPALVLILTAELIMMQLIIAARQRSIHL